MEHKWTAGSLFSGIGGIDLAANAVGFDILFQVEIDDFCRNVLEQHAPNYWKNAQLFKDVHDVGQHNLPAVDLLFGGFPCQSISIAGQQTGIKRGTASGLWFEFRRILGEIRPRFVLLENVGNITNVGGTTVIGDLAALGYDAIWMLVQAADVGASHRRERWFCIAHTDRFRRPESDFTSRQHPPHPKRKHPPKKQRRHSFIRPAARSHQGVEHPRRTRRKLSSPGRRQRLSTKSGHLGNPDHTGFRKQRRPIPIRQKHPTPQHPGSPTTGRSVEPRFRRADDGVSGRLDRLIPIAPPNQSQYAWEAPRTVAPGSNPNRREQLKALGNAVVPQQVEPILLAISQTLEQSS